jgi:hypothetical protein
MTGALAYLVVLLVFCAVVGVVAAVLDRRRGRRIAQDPTRSRRQGRARRRQ